MSGADFCPHVLTTLHIDGSTITGHTCDNCGADRPIPEASHAPCPHDGVVVFGSEGEPICAVCQAVMPLPDDSPAPDPAPAKPPRRMLQPTKATLRERIAALEALLDETTNTIQILNRELEAAREAHHRLWAETRPERTATVLDILQGAFADAWAFIRQRIKGRTKPRNSPQQQ